MSGGSLVVVVAGIGNEYRQDDGAGVAVAKGVALAFDFVRDLGPIGEPLDLLGQWEDADLAVVIDATRTGVAPGTIALVELDESSDAERSVRHDHSSTHGLGLIDVLRLSRALDAAPRRVVLVAIEGAAFGSGVGMCAEVQGAIPKATAMVVELVSRSL